MKSIDIKIETQSFDNKIISVCHINKGYISLENSDIARKLFIINRPLFEAINKRTYLINASIHREETIKEKLNYNYLMSKVESVHEFREKEILNFSFNNSSVVDCHRFELASGLRVDITADKLNNYSNGGPLDLNNITIDDLNSAKEIAKVSRIKCYDDLGLESFVLVDNLTNNYGILKIKHKVQITYQDEFLNYINNLLKELLKSINFLKVHFSSSKSSSNYDATTGSYRKSFIKNTFSKFGLDASFASRVELTDESILNSEFGKVGVIYYNSISILEKNVDKSIYQKVLKQILPTKLSSPDSVESVIAKMSDFYNRINKEYIGTKKNKDGVFKQNILSFNKVSSLSNLFTINREKLGYRLFKEPVDFNRITKNSYIMRSQSEKQRYYPVISSANASYLYPSEVQEFNDLSNYLSYLTPLEILTEGKRIAIDRGLGNLNVEDIKVFRLLKAASYRNRVSKNLQNKMGPSLVDKTLSTYNLQIEPPRKSIRQKRTNGEFDPLIDSKYYLGDDTYFQSFEPEKIINYIRFNNSKEKRKILNIVVGIIPRKFLRPKNSIQKIKDIQISKKQSAINKLITEKKISLKSIPPQIKFMMMDSFQPIPEVDPIKNFDSREIIEETQKNIFKIRALIGFEKNEDGLIDLSMPIFQDVSEQLMNSDKSYLLKGYDYEVPELGIVKDKMLATIYNNLFLLE